VRRPTCEHDPANAGPPVYGPPTDPATLTDPWEGIVPTTTTEIPRDRWGRPLILPSGGGEVIAYTRASTHAKALDDLNNLMAWKVRKALEGVVKRPDLLTRAAGALANGDPDADWPTKKALNGVASEAHEAAGGSAGASSGTGLHALTEAVDRGEGLLWVPPADQARLDAYVEATAHLTPLDSETFVVCDELRVAGTFDRLWRDDRTGAVLVGDLKTGKSEVDYPMATATQLAIYAHGLRYDPESGERSPLHADLDQTTGLLVHLPAAGGCEVVPLDLALGWEAARLAAQVRDLRAVKAQGWKVGA
jgi:hypothetical protein